MLGICDCATHTGTHHDLNYAWHLVGIGVFELVFEGGYSYLGVFFVESIHYFLPAGLSDLASGLAVLASALPSDLASDFLALGLSDFLAALSWLGLTLKMRSLLPSAL